MQPSNPIRDYDGNFDGPGFTYEPGAHPFYVTMRTPGYIAMSLVGFADDEAHMRRIMMEAHKYATASLRRRARRRRDREYESNDHHWRKWAALKGCVETGEPFTIQWKHYEHGLRNDTYTLTIAPFDRTHMLKVGWAGNDTI